MWRETVRASSLVGALIGAVLGLTGCAEALRTDRPTVIQPSPSLPNPAPMADESTPQLGNALDEQESDAPEVAPSLPLQGMQLPTEPVAGTAITIATPLATVTSTPEEIVVSPTPQAPSNEQRWRAQQVNREVFDSPRIYSTPGSQLWWYDPINQQHVILGSFSGVFEAQARFELAGQGVEALEVPYRINQRYGLTALSPALVGRMQAAGYNDWVETYVLVSPDITRQK